MHPEICKIGSFTIYSYGLALVGAFFICSYLSGRQAEKERFDPEEIFNLLFYVFLWGIIGSRLFYVFYNFAFYFKHPLEVFMLQRGGMAWFGGLCLGTAAAVVLIKRKKLDPLKTIDLLVPFVALGQAIGRIGCLLNGCCYGRVSEFGLYFEVHDKILMPTQLYSSLLLIGIFLILRLIQDRKHLPGQVLASYLFLYSIKRFIIEIFRNDSPKFFYGLTIFQLLSIALFIISIVLFRVISRRKDTGKG